MFPPRSLTIISLFIIISIKYLKKRRKGFEPSTSTLARWHSSQLNYRRKLLVGCSKYVVGRDPKQIYFSTYNLHPTSYLIIIPQVPREGLEPPRITPLVPKTSASTNSASGARLRKNAFAFNKLLTSLFIK